MEESISLKQILGTLKKRAGLIFFVVISAAIISSVVTIFLLTPIYQASTQLLVNQTKDEKTFYNNNELQTNVQLVNTYSVIIKSPAILEKVAEELSFETSASELNQKITVQSEKNSQVVSVSVNDPDPYNASDIANKTAEVFQREIVKIMNVDNVSILAKASVTDITNPIKPNLLLNIAMALALGTMAGVGLAFLLDYLDNTIKSEQDIEKLLELPVLGVIANIKPAGKKEAERKAKEQLRGETVGS